MAPPEKPGLGIGLDPQAVNRYTFSGVEEVV